MMALQKSYKFTPCAVNKTEEAYTGCLYTSQSTLKKLQQVSGLTKVFMNVNGFIFQVRGENGYNDNTLGANKYTRQLLKLSFTEDVEPLFFYIPKDKEYRLSVLDIELELIQSTAQEGKFELDDGELSKHLKKLYSELFFKQGQTQLFEFQGNVYLFKITRTETMSLGVDNAKQDLLKFHLGGMLVDETNLEFSVKAGQQAFKLKSTSQKVVSIFRDDFTFDKMGVGGLDKELANIFRRAFSSRRFPQAFLDKYNIQHVKGLLLFGPPGTGKTLIARQLAKVLKAQPPKIVNGPEIFSKYVGEAEENVRKLFAEAIADQDSKGDESPLHIIVFDEMDAICKQRGSIQGGSGAYDNVVNQLLSMIDGVNALNNILVIGMTNRKDLIDEAVLRPGRFEVHIEVGLPDENGRQQILQIHTEHLYKNGAIENDVKLDELASLTKNYTGAEIQALVKSASSFSFQRIQSITDFQKKLSNTNDFKIRRADFMQALEEVKPQFGVDTNKFDVLLRNKLIDFGEDFRKIQKMIKNCIEQTRFGNNSQLNSLLIEGSVGCGKTSIAAWAAVECGFSFVKLISPEGFIGLTEGAIINQMVRIFNDAYKSSTSCIVIDQIERLIEYVDIGPRFSNPILQALLVLIKRLPDKPQNRLLIIGTTSVYKILQQLEVVQCFNLTLNIPNLKKPEEIIAVLGEFCKNDALVKKIASSINDVPLKKLLLFIDMASTGENGLNYEDFIQCYQNFQLTNY